LKRERSRTAAPGSLEEARKIVAKYVEDYNHVRLQSALGYVTPADKLAGREQVIYDERDRKLEEARARRAAARQAARLVA
jgi:transposase InsO family protein